MNARPEAPSSNVDPMVSDAITAIRDRFGADGLRDVINLANKELAQVQQAERELAALEQTRGQAGPTDETQAWLAFTEAEPSNDDKLT